MAITNTEVQNVFTVPLEGYFFHKAVLGLNSNFTGYLIKAAPENIRSVPAISDLFHEISGVETIETWDQKAQAKVIREFKIDVSALSPVSILSGKVSSVSYKIDSGDEFAKVGELRLPNVPALEKAREKLSKQATAGDISLPIKGHLFGQECLVSSGWGHKKIVFKPYNPQTQYVAPFYFEIAEGTIGALHQTERRVGLSADKKHIVLHVNQLTEEEKASRRIEKVRYCMAKIEGDYKDQAPIDVDGRIGYITFEKEDLPLPARDLFSQEMKK